MHSVSKPSNPLFYVNYNQDGIVHYGLVNALETMDTGLSNHQPFKSKKEWRSFLIRDMNVDQAEIDFFITELS